jgi:enterobactin synthetase component D
LQHAAAKRKAEHLAGRYLCKKILQRHALPCIVPIGAFREPVWPAGWTGSITHSTGMAMSCLSRKSDIALLGIDFESWVDDGLARDIADMIIDRHERHILSSGPWQFSEHLSLVFSAKESFYKAAFPVVGRIFDFHCVRMIDIDFPNGQYRFQVMETLAPSLRAGRIVAGAFRCETEGILTWVAERPGTDHHPTLDNQPESLS